MSATMSFLTVGKNGTKVTAINQRQEFHQKLRLMLLVSAVKIIVQIFLSCQKIFASPPYKEKYERENFFHIAGNKKTVAKRNGTGLTEETGPSPHTQG
jgi:hypothetical protein